MTSEETIERANRAEKLLSDPLLTEAFNALRTTILNNIEAAPIRDKAGVHECRLMLKVLGNLKGHLEQAIRDGKVLMHRLEERKKHERMLEDEKRRMSPVDFSASYRR
jgi:hypothetical protein